MFVDHIGYYIFPEWHWLRVLGRLCVPIWFFLIGYARTRELTGALWAGVIILMITNIIVGAPLFPITILLNFILIRVTIDHLAHWSFKSRDHAVVTFILLSCLFIPTNAVMEYGTAGMAFALTGYMLRNGDGQGGRFQFPIFLVVYGVFALYETLVFGFTPAQAVVLLLGLMGIAWVLWNFSPKNYPIRAEMGGIGVISPCVKWIGRNTLIIYVIHVIILKLIDAYFHLNHYGFGNAIRIW